MIGPYLLKISIAEEGRLPSLQDMPEQGNITNPQVDLLARKQWLDGRMLLDGRSGGLERQAEADCLAALPRARA
jgi:hypothetical protein